MKTRSISALVAAVLSAFLGASGRAEQTIQCPQGTIDIVDWMTLDADLRNTKHMGGGGYMATVLWPDKFFWMKSTDGGTLDINLYDSNFVYLWYTELTWHHPYDFRKHSWDFNVPMTQRCATPGYPGSSMFVSDTSYSTYVNCTFMGISNVLKAVFKIWGPYTAGQPGLETWRPRLGGSIPDSTPVYVLQYQYNCNQYFQNCADSEEFYFTKRYGWVRHEYWHNGQLMGRGTWSTLLNGTVPPFAPCLEGDSPLLPGGRECGALTGEEASAEEWTPLMPALEQASPFHRPVEDWPAIEPRYQ